MIDFWHVTAAAGVLLTTFALGGLAWLSPLVFLLVLLLVGLALAALATYGAARKHRREKKRPADNAG